MTDLATEAADRRDRMARMSAARPPVDSQGRPLSKPATYQYDDRGLLVQVEAPE